MNEREKGGHTLIPNLNRIQIHFDRPNEANERE